MNVTSPPRPANAAADARVAQAWTALEAIPDPEIPVVSIRELGILRGIVVDADGMLEVTITPTYSGCPAMSQIAEDIGHALDAAGLAPWRLRTVLAPAWTTDWITPAARERLREFGIAPPGQCGTPAAAQSLRFVPRAARAGAPDRVACPRCGSVHTQEISRFASTACKALYRCLDCREPFDYFKPY
ncbi:1,2-phenylacetyl-CoA epoxidase subunit PaaD [Cupriavidus consociatus]|uniref:1,2-phenylacetyl-CoA epoxidase subunit PaaD n=1 Tax=Cupriavidus consociatus TaxID=2821357 RepID=UPI001AE4BE32|nr:MULTISPECIES: 1,2-phenylacetyl-CoA epoxidase subunit PaaD [unclassified Cupriavidus]MBP0622944.1 phenylacetate-CoA oxygenase subunit PaaJ [Cupriavidus sp. LEh25]MDK2659632.1 phenylacetate-CoA oxygenase subunit PaaJ [Cupriavidus sp. LEh21]